MRRSMKDSQILVVEDCEDLLLAWKTLFLSMTEYDIRFCTGGLAALEIVDNGFHPDVVITDYYLADTNGWELIQAIRKNHPTTSFIMVTANPEHDPLSALAGVEQFTLLVKPIKFSLLLAKIQQHLASKKEKKEMTQSMSSSEYS